MNALGFGALDPFVGIVVVGHRHENMAGIIFFAHSLNFASKLTRAVPWFDGEVNIFAEDDGAKFLSASFGVRVFFVAGFEKFLVDIADTTADVGAGVVPNGDAAHLMLAAVRTLLKTGFPKSVAIDAGSFGDSLGNEVLSDGESGTTTRDLVDDGNILPF